MKREEYKGFIIENNTTRHGGKQFTIYNKNELFVMNCNTKKECKEKIDTYYNTFSTVKKQLNL